MLLDEQIVALEQAFVAAGIPHAFGGAQALAYYGSVRATHDIDVNVFLPAAEAERVFGVLGSLGAAVQNPGLRRLAALGLDFVWVVPGSSNMPREVGAASLRSLGADVVPALR